MAKRLTHWLLIALVLSLGFGQLMRFELFGLPIFLHDILVLAILALNLQGQALKGNKYTSSLKLILLGLAIGAIRALTFQLYAGLPWADSLSSLLIPFLYSARLIIYLLFYLTIRNSRYKIHNTYLFLAGTISLIIGLTQYFLMPDMRIFQYLGWDDHLSRLTLPHFDPTFSGAILVMFLLYPLSFSSLIYHLSSIIWSAGILLTYSRSIWLSFALTAFIFTKRKASTLFVICSLLFVIFVALPRKLGEGTNLLRTYSVVSRIDHDLTLSSRVGWNFLIGIGYNTLPLLIDSSSTDIPYHTTGFNNSFLTILATSGIIGLTGWIIFLRRLYQDHISLRPIITFLIIGSFFNNLLLYPFTLLLLLLLTAPTSTSH